MVVSLNLTTPSKEPVSETLLIDRLAVTVPQKDEKTCKEIWSVLQQCGEDTTAFVKKAFPGKLYDTELTKIVPAAKGNVHVGAALFKKSGPFVRFDWNPSKLGAEGHLEFKAMVEGMLPYGFHDIETKGRITRIDVTVDLHGININDIAVVPNISTTGSAYWDKKGALETPYIGSKKSDAFWRVYDKARAQKLSNGIEITRIERVHKYDFPFSALVDFANPFSKIAVCYVSANKVIPAIDPVMWQLFQDTCRHTGATPALAKLTKHRRTQFRMALKADAANWWKPQETWLGRHPLLHQLKLVKTPST